MIEGIPRVTICVFLAILVLSLPVNPMAVTTVNGAYADESIINTIGKNYDLVEDYTVGEAIWKSHPERIMVGDDWKNYHYEQTDGKIIFQTNTVGSLVYDVNTCSYSVYENGYDGEQILPSISWIARSALDQTDDWNDLTELNDAQCTVDVIEHDEGITITSLKSLDEFSIEQRNIPYIVDDDSVDTIIKDGINYDVEILWQEAVSPQNMTQATVRGFIALEDVNVVNERLKFEQVLDLDIRKGVKETVRIYNDELENHKFGAIQTINTGNTLTISDQTFDIEQANGTVLSREWIVENEGTIFEVADGLFYDIDRGLEHLNAISIVYDTVGKIALD